MEQGDLHLDDTQREGCDGERPGARCEYRAGGAIKKRERGNGGTREQLLSRLDGGGRVPVFPRSPVPGSQTGYPILCRARRPSSVRRGGGQGGLQTKSTGGCFAPTGWSFFSISPAMAGAIGQPTAVKVILMLTSLPPLRTAY